MTFWDTFNTQAAPRPEPRPKRLSTGQRRAQARLAAMTPAEHACHVCGSTADVMFSRCERHHDVSEAR